MSDKAAIESIKRKRVFKVTDLAQLLNCSLPTCRRRLKLWHTLTSYNHNGRYYALPEIPQFNTRNLWHYNGISFSKYGNLKKTVVELIRESSSGLSASELGDILQMNPRSFLSHFQNDPALSREKLGGCYIWFVAISDICKKQKQMRMKQVSEYHIVMPTDRESVLILVDLLHHENTKIAELTFRLKSKGVIVDKEAIHHFLAQHDLLKKTMDSTSSTV